jgi:non-heme chloroperoxidase
MTPVINSVELPNRVMIPYVEHGSPSSTPMLLVHGVTDSWHSYELVLPYLPESIHAIALTQRGHGDASRPATSYRFRDFSADLAMFMDTLHIKAAVIVGHSMGSTVAQRFAIDHPKRTLGLVLAGSFASLRGNAGVQELWDSAVSKLTDPVDPGFVREFQESTLARPGQKAFFETIVQESLKVPARVWRAAFEGFLEDDFSAELSKIKAPTLIIWGDQDAFCPRSDQTVLSNDIAGSRLLVYPGTGHAVHWEEAERFALDLTAFAKGLVN